MKKWWIILALLGVSLTLGAQNNPLEIDNECYSRLQEVERLEGKPGFEHANSRLLSKAIEKGDTKAQTLYYVEQLKDLTRRYKDIEKVSEQDDQKVLDAMYELTHVASDLGLQREFYYAYELAQSHFYRHQKLEKAMDLLHEMRDTAIKRGEEYGIWMGNRYIVSLYLEQSDYISAKRYILEAIRMYESSTDPTIRQQSATRLYCNLSDCYPIGHDSVRVNLRKAEFSSKQHLDTLRLNYHKAKLAAFSKDISSYQQARDYCKRDPQLGIISPTAIQLFNNIDLIVYGRYQEPPVDISDMIYSIREVKYIANTAEEYGYKDLAFNIEKKLVVFHENNLSLSNRSKIAEIDARLGNDLLHAQANEASLRAQKAYRLVMLLFVIVLVIVIVFLVIHLSGLRKTNERVRLADAAKTRFVQNMSHEVRTPLNAIVGFSQLLSLPDGSFTEEEKAEFSSHIVNNTKMLIMLLDDILNASAMDSGNYKINYEDGEMHYMAEAAISSSEHRLQPGVKMQYVPESREPFVFHTDPGRVQQILINMLTNACKHTSAGEITLASSLTETPGFVTYSVTDTGPGVPPEQAEKIFERFTKLNDFVQGTGLGLSICRDIARRMGAKIFLDTSYTGGGARFVFTVPCKPLEENA